MGLFDTQQEKNERIAREAYQAGRNSTALDRWSQHNIIEATRALPGHEQEEEIYKKNFKQGEEDQFKFGKDRHAEAPLETRVEETPESSSDDSDGELSDEDYERLAGIIGEALQKAREEIEEEREQERLYAREAEEMRGINARVAEEARKKVERIASLDRFYDLSISELEKVLYTTSDLEERSRAAFAKVAKETDEHELMLHAEHYEKVVTEGQESESDMAYFLGKRVLEIKARRKKEEARELEKQLRLSEKDRYLFVMENPRHPIAGKLLETISQPDYIQSLYDNPQALMNHFQVIDKKINEVYEAKRRAEMPWIIRFIESFIH